MPVVAGSVVTYARSYIQWQDAGDQAYTDTELWSLNGDTETAFVGNFVVFLQHLCNITNARLANAYLEFVNKYPLTNSAPATNNDVSVISAAYAIAAEKPNTIRGTGKFRVVLPVPAYLKATLFTSISDPWDASLNTANLDIAAITAFMNTYIAIREPVTGSFQTGFVFNKKDSAPITLDDITDNS